MRAERKLWPKVIVAAIVAALSFSPARAWATLTIHVSANGMALKDAVVTAVARQGLEAPQGRPARAEMIQENKQFSPFVLPIQVGTTVAFPNRDSFRHHVYSFSPAKSFELKLFGTGQLRTVTFDKEGVVVLGCNIHDNMLAYIYVVNTPYFAKTNDEGVANVALPPGSYTLAVWHPDQKEAAATRELTVGDGANETVEMTMTLKRERRQQRPPAVDESTY